MAELGDKDVSFGPPRASQEGDPKPVWGQGSPQAALCVLAPRWEWWSQGSSPGNRAASVNQATHPLLSSVAGLPTQPLASAHAWLCLPRNEENQPNPRGKCYLRGKR